MVKPLAITIAILATILTFMCFKKIRTDFEQNKPVNGMVQTVYQRVAVETYAPGFGNMFNANFMELRWKLNFFPICLLVGIAVGFGANVVGTILLVSPSRSMVEDPEYQVQHAGIDTPVLCHLDDILFVVPPRNFRVIQEDLLVGGMSAFAPPSVSVNLSDRPKYLKEPPPELQKMKKT